MLQKFILREFSESFKTNWKAAHSEASSETKWASQEYSNSNSIHKLTN